MHCSSGFLLLIAFPYLIAMWRYVKDRNIRTQVASTVAIFLFIYLRSERPVSETTVVEQILCYSEVAVECQQ